jgi:uncharacterized membrane protein YfhO
MNGVRKVSTRRKSSQASAIYPLCMVQYKIIELDCTIQIQKSFSLSSKFLVGSSTCAYA